jgi:hypothetical protein
VVGQSQDYYIATFLQKVTTMIKRNSAALAALGAIIALLISIPFALMYFRAYGFGEGQTPPAYLITFGEAFPSLVNFGRATCVYQIYGRIYSLVVPLTIPALLALKRCIGTYTKLAKWGWRVFYNGVLMFGLGVIGDYWPNQNSFWVGAGFLFELLGMLVFGAGALLYGVATLRGDTVPRWVGYGLVGIAPGGVLGLLLLAHIPAGPLFGYVLFWLVMGVQIFWRREENER